ncbi:MAG: GyrI-like domain-containing protein [Nitrospira sp.]|nr:GyrI-like domain-containing protein [Nitrospira sp.]
MMDKINHKQKLKHLYQPSAKEVAEVDVPSMNFLMIDGQGDPNTSKAYADAVEALFAVAYAVKFMIKKGPSAIDYGVMPLEGLWWTDDMAKFSTADKAKWKWTAMIMQPPPVTKGFIEKAIVDVGKKKKLSALPDLRFEELAEGKCAQILHVGPFSEEGPTIERVHQFIQSRGGKLIGKHHEIYLSDIRKADAKKWKTVIRQPFALAKSI